MRIVRPFFAAAFLAATAIAVSTPAAASGAPDPIEGKWAGMAGFPTDRVEIGMEFRRDEKGVLTMYLFQPVINFYGVETGPVTRDGDSYKVPAYVVSLKLKGDTLEGTYFPFNAPISMKRVEKLASEVPLPDFPKGPGPKWKTALGGSIFAAAAVRDGIAYVGTTAGTMHAIDLKDGDWVWMFLAGRPIHGAALATDEHVYFVCDNGYLFKLDRKTGKEIWRYDLGDERSVRPMPHQVLDKRGIGEFDFDVYSPRPTLADGVLYVGSGDGSLHAVDAASGRRVWRFEGKGKVRKDAAVDGERVYFGGWGGLVYAVDRKTGKEVWQKDTRADVTSSPTLIGDRLIVGNRGGLLAALKPATGETIWKMLFWGSSVESTPVPAGGDLFFIGSSDLRRLSLIDSKDARVVYRTDVFGLAWPRPALTERRVYASAGAVTPSREVRHLGSLSSIDRATGKIVWRWPSTECCGYYSGFLATPVVDGKTLVVGSMDGTLYAFPVDAE